MKPCVFAKQICIQLNRWTVAEIPKVPQLDHGLEVQLFLIKWEDESNESIQLPLHTHPSPSSGPSLLQSSHILSKGQDRISGDPPRINCTCLKWSFNSKISKGNRNGEWLGVSIFTTQLILYYDSTSFIIIIIIHISSFLQWIIHSFNK